MPLSHVDYVDMDLVVVTLLSQWGPMLVREEESVWSQLQRGSWRGQWKWMIPNRW